MKNHLKRIAMPRTWYLPRKSNKFILRPHAGSHSMDMGHPIGVVLRDVLKVTSTLAEAQKLLNNNVVLIDGRRVKDRRHMYGLYDILKLGDNTYRMELDTKGRLVVNEVEPTSIKVVKVVGKNVIKGGKIQLRLFDGKTLISDVKVSVGDSVKYNIESRSIESVLPCSEGANMFLLRGKHAGDNGVLTKIEGRNVVYQKGTGENIETTLKHVYVTEGSQ